MANAIVKTGPARPCSSPNARSYVKPRSLFARFRGDRLMRLEASESQDGLVLGVALVGLW
jgi:hypothetical protein